LRFLRKYSFFLRRSRSEVLRNLHGLLPIVDDRFRRRCSVAPCRSRQSE